MVVTEFHEHYARDVPDLATDPAEVIEGATDSTDFTDCYLDCFFRRHVNHQPPIYSLGVGSIPWLFHCASWVSICWRCPAGTCSSGIHSR